MGLEYWIGVNRQDNIHSMVTVLVFNLLIF